MEEQRRPEDDQPAAGGDDQTLGEARPRPETHLVFAGLTDVGRQRKHNEDCVLIKSEHQLFCVADGMGGHNAGDVASKLVTTSLGNYFDATAGPGDAPETADEYAELVPGARRLVAGVSKANRDVFTISSTVQQHHGMGSTVVAIHLAEGMVHVAHVGDSRCYRIRDGEMTQLTRDHSLINDALDMKPDLTKEELARLPKNIITRALGMKDVVKVDVKSEPVLPGDAFLLCSDGLTGMVPVPQILDVINLAAEPHEACELLIAEANDHGGSDNISAVLVRIEEGPPEARPAPRATAHAEVAPDSDGDADAELMHAGELVAEAEVEISPESGRVTFPPALVSAAAAEPKPAEPPKPLTQPVTSSPARPETPKPPAQPVTMGETPKPPAQPVPAPAPSRPVLAAPPPPPPVPRIPAPPPVPRASSPGRIPSQPSVPEPRASSPARMPSQPPVPELRASSPARVPSQPPVPVTMGETPKPPAQPVSSSPARPETPKPPAQPVTMGETPKPPAQPAPRSPSPLAAAAPSGAAAAAPSAAVAAAAEPPAEQAVVRARVLEIVPDPDEDLPPLPREPPDLDVGRDADGLDDLSPEEAAALAAGGEIDLDLRGPWSSRATVQRCTRCRHELYPGNLFCVECGARIESAPDELAGEP